MSEQRPMICWLWLGARCLRLLLGYLWGAMLLLLGLSLWREPEPIEAWLMGAITIDPYTAMRFVRALAVFAVAGSLFVFMFLVADDICPNAPIKLTGTLEFVCGVVSLGALAWAVWLGWTVVG